jgi:hypothetical protein
MIHRVGAFSTGSLPERVPLAALASPCPGCESNHKALQLLEQ